MNPENLESTNRALVRLSAGWGRTEAEWGPVPKDWKWLQTQSVFCLTTDYGALDVFRQVRGLEGSYPVCKARAVVGKTPAGVQYSGLSHRDMLACALTPVERKDQSLACGAGVVETQAMNWDELKAAEERKRDAAYDPKKRWLHIQQTITWAESVMPYHLRRNRPRTRPENALSSTSGAEDTAKRESPADLEPN